MGKIVFLALILAVITPVYAYDTSPDISPDNRFVVFERIEEPGGASSIVISPVENPACRVLAPGRLPQFNPDGSKVIYVVDSPDKSVPAIWKKRSLSSVCTDICIADVDGSNVKQLTKCGGMFPMWSPEGDKIAYLNAEGYLCSLPAAGGSPKIITRSSPCFRELTWLPDLHSFVGTIEVKGKLARYAFTPPSTTPVRISMQHQKPAGALAISFNPAGQKMAYLLRKPVSDTPTFELWVSWGSGKRRVCDIPSESTDASSYTRPPSISWSADGGLAAVACAGKIWIVELGSGKTTLVSGPPVQPENADSQQNTSQPVESGDVTSSNE